MDDRRESPPDADTESPSRDRTEGAAGALNDPDPEDTENPSAGDQDIDTAGTDADDESPTKAVGTGLAPPRQRG